MAHKYATLRAKLDARRRRRSLSYLFVVAVILLAALCVNACPGEPLDPIRVFHPDTASTHPDTNPPARVDTAGK